MQETHSYKQYSTPSTHGFRSHAFSPFEALLQEARPHLLRFAYRQGLAPDLVEDVVQETLLTATRIHERLWSPDRFYPWLESICRHTALHHLRSAQARAKRELSLSLLLEDRHLLEGEQLLTPNLLNELLDQQDLSTLLDRALSHLTAQNREVVELCYLTGIPHKEVAKRLQMNLNTLDVRLHRARRQLFAVLHGPLRAQAEASGLKLGADETASWQEIRIWCWGCGKRRLRAILEPLPNHLLNLRLRCPSCSASFGKDLFWTKGIVPLKGIRSLRPALKKAQATNYQIFAHLVAKGVHRCPACALPITSQIGSSEGLGIAFPGQYWIIMRCPTCGPKTATVGFTVCYTDSVVSPVFSCFIQDHPQWIAEPTIPVTCMGQPALRLRIQAVTCSARLTILVHRDTLHLLSYFHE